MKQKISRMWRSALSALLAVCLVVGLCPSVAFATGNEPEVKYVSLGDSMTNGYCLTGYSDVNGYLEESPDAYPAKVAAHFGWDLTHQLAMSAMRAEDLHYILEYPDGYKGDQYTYDEFIDGRFAEDCGGVEEAAAVYQTAVADADVISLGIGNANFGVFMLGRITNALGILGGDVKEDSWIDLETALVECDPETKAFVLEAYAALKAELYNYVSEDAQEIVEPLANAIAYALTSYVLNYGGVIDRIVELNPDVEIIIVGLMNTFSGMEMSYEGEIIDLGAVMDTLIGTVNTYLAALPTVLQAAGKYPEATFYYAEATNVSMIVDNFADEIKMEGTVTRERTITEVCDMVWPMLNKMTEAAGNGSPYIEISPENVKEYEAALAGGAETFAAYVAGNSGKLQSIATYLAFEKATVEASQLDVLDANAFITLATGLDGIFDGVYADFEQNLEPTTAEKLAYMSFASDVDALLGNTGAYTQTVYTLVALPDAMSAALTADETVYSLLNLFARMLIGNGVGCHPSAEGHDTLTAEIIEAYENGFTVQDQVTAKVEIALDEIAKLVEQYGPEVLDEVYNYAVEQGYVAALETAVAELKAELETRTENYLNEAKKAQLEAAVGETAEGVEEVIAQLEETIAALEATIAAVESQIADIEAAVAELEAGLDAIGQELADLAQAVVELENAAAAVVNVLKGAADTSVEAVIAAVEAARDAACAAAGLVETTYDQVAALIGEVTELAVLTGEKVAALAEMVAADLQAAYDALPEEVKAEIEAAVAEIQKAAEEAVACVEAELAEQIAALKAELQPIIDAKVAELEAVLAQMEQEIAEKTAELKAQLAEKQAELESLIAELENAAEEQKAAIEEKIAEVEAAIAELEAQINQIREQVEAAYAEAVEALEEAIEELKAELEAKIAELTEAAEEKIAEIIAEAEAKIAQLQAAGEAIAEELAAILEEIKNTVEAVKTEVEAMVGETIDNVEDLIAAAQVMAENLLVTVEEKVQEVIDAFEDAYVNATTSNYVPDENSFYVAIGDSSAVSESYVDVLAENLGVDYANLAQENLLVEDTYAVLEKNAETIAKADLITVGFTSNGFVNEAINQVTGFGAGEMDWATYVGAENVPYVEEVLAELSAYIAESVDNAQTAAMLTTAVEAYAYSCVSYACNLPEVINAIRAINPDATIVIVGMYNPLEDVTVALDENTTINIGEYLDYLTEAAGVHATAYAMLTSNGIYIAAPDVQTVYEANGGSNTMALDSLLMEYLRNWGKNMLPSEEGHEYIAAQIAGALTKNAETPEETVLYGDVDRDGDVDGMDLLRLQKYLAGDDVEIDLKAADVDANAGVDGKDLLRLQKYLAGDNVTLG